MEKISQYCQKCRAANEPGEMTCWRCGTTLMLVVYPPSVQHEEMIIPTYYEDHLLERVSLLELRLSQLTEKMSLALDLMLKQAKTTQADHALLKSILETLDSYGIAESNDAIPIKNKSADAPKANKNSLNQSRLETIVTNHKSANAELFTHLVEEGVKLFEQTEEKQAFRMLERAALLSPENTELSLFIAEKFFKSEKYSDARRFLEQANKYEPTNHNVLLMLGAIYADEGETEKARRMLSVLASDKKTESIVNYVWGMSAAFENNWNEALAAFKTSMAGRDSAELEYLIACCYFQLRMTDKAQTFFHSATEKNNDFADAWFMRGFTETDDKLAETALKEAQKVKDTGAQCFEFLKSRKKYQLETALPFLHFKKENPRLLTKGSLRLIRFFKSEILKAIK